MENTTVVTKVEPDRWMDSDEGFSCLAQRIAQAISTIETVCKGKKIKTLQVANGGVQVTFHELEQ
jgi:hypothetical protein